MREDSSRLPSPEVEDLGSFYSMGSTMLKLRVNRGLLALYMCQMLRTKQSGRDFQQNVQVVSLGKTTGWGKDRNFFYL